MAAGDTLLVLNACAACRPHASIPAAPVLRNGHFTWAFGPTTNSEVNWFIVMPNHWGGSQLDVNIYWTAEDDDSGNVVWRVHFERWHSTFDTDATGWDTYTSFTSSSASAAGEIKVASIVNITLLDSFVAGESGRIGINREASSGSDTLTNDAQILAVTLVDS